MDKRRILATASVDELRRGLWEVEVNGGPQGGEEYRRVYDISAKSDKDAAQEGISKFCEEVGNLEYLGMEATNEN